MQFFVNCFLWAGFRWGGTGQGETCFVAIYKSPDVLDGDEER